MSGFLCCHTFRDPIAAVQFCLRTRDIQLASDSTLNTSHDIWLLIFTSVFFLHFLAGCAHVSRIRSLFSRCCLFIESVDGGENMTHLSNMNRMGVCSTTKISNISFGTAHSGTNYIYEKKKSTTVYSKNYNHRSNEVPSVAFCVCASQALNPNPWINVLWLLACTSCSFALAHPIIFANHFSPYHKKVGRVVLHWSLSPLSLQPMLLMPLLQFLYRWSQFYAISSHIQHSCHFTTFIMATFTPFKAR